MSRSRIRARLIYRQWSILEQTRWIPPYGWISKTAALGLGYRMGRFSSTFGLPYGGQQIPREAGGDIYADTAKSIFETMVSWRDSDVALPLDPTRYRK